MDLHQRVERLERANRRLKFFGLSTLLAIGVLFLAQVGIGQPQRAYANGSQMDAEFGTIKATTLLLAGKNQATSVRIDGDKFGFVNIKDHTGATTIEFQGDTGKVSAKGFIT